LSSPTPATFTTSGVEIFFQSARAGLNAELSSRLTSFIDGTEHSLDVAIYDLRHPAILEALARQPRRGVRLRLAYDGGSERTGGLGADPKPGGTEEALAAAGLLPYATAVHEKGRHLMHDKFLVRDGKTVWMGSANFTLGGLELQDNNCLTLASTRLAASYVSTLEELIQPEHQHAHESGTVPTVEVGTTPMRPYFEPADGDGIGHAIASALQGARRIRIAAFLLSDPGILAALLPFASDPHVDIAGVYDPNGMDDVLRYSHQDPHSFWFLHDPRFVAAPSHGYSAGHEQDFMHNKVFVIDDRLVFTGSYNFSANARENDEAVLAMDSTDIAGAYTHYIDTLIATYKANKVGHSSSHASEESLVSHESSVRASHPVGRTSRGERSRDKVATPGQQASVSRTPQLDRAISVVIALLVVVLIIAILLAVLALRSGS
jgi:phosphatidylserine/phosphatidylglycerophosphate/cardiolipin synthase-like enzyme